jgi:hypothetical protein
MQRCDDGLRWRYPCSERKKMRYVVVREPLQVKALLRQYPCQFPIRVRQRMVRLQSEVAVGAYNAQRGGVHLPCDKLQEQERGRISPLQVIKDKDQGPSLGSVFQKRGKTIEEAEALLGWLQRRQAGQVREALTDFRYHLSQCGSSGPYLCLEGLGRAGHQIAT